MHPESIHRSRGAYLLLILLHVIQIRNNKNLVKICKRQSGKKFYTYFCKTRKLTDDDRFFHIAT